MAKFFTDVEVKKAENMLELLAYESARFWAEALNTESFLYHGRSEYLASSYYKSASWHDEPNEEQEPIKANQILKFVEVYLEEARKKLLGIFRTINM